jgi:lipopolysaccharide transport system permease protein
MALNVIYRDIRYVIPFLVRLGMFATSTVCMLPKAGLAGWVLVLLALNPMTGLIAAFCTSILNGPIPAGRLGSPRRPRSSPSSLVACIFSRPEHENRFL